MNNLSAPKKNTLVDMIIIIFLFLVVLFFESLKTLLELFSYGILKKEILTSNSKLGFDLKIKIR